MDSLNWYLVGLCVAACGGSSPGSANSAASEAGDPEGLGQCLDWEAELFLNSDRDFGDSGGFSNDGGTGGADETSEGLGTGIPIGSNVFAVQRFEHYDGDWVELDSLVVTSAPAAVVGGWRLFAQAPAGGPDSGITLFIPTGTATEWARPGRRVRIRGHLISAGDRFALAVTPGGWRLEGEGPLPAPSVLDAGTLADPSALAALRSVMTRLDEVVVNTVDGCDGVFALNAPIALDTRLLDRPVPGLGAGAQLGRVTGPLVDLGDRLAIAPVLAADLDE